MFMMIVIFRKLKTNYTKVGQKLKYNNTYVGI